MSSPIQHQISAEHCPCRHCVLLDNYILLLEARLPPIDCPECKQGFSHKVSLEAHQREKLHACCYNCSIVFPTRELHALHMQSHAPALARLPSPAIQFRCCDCQRDFRSEGALTDHLHCSSIHRPGKRSKNKKKMGKEQNLQEQGKRSKNKKKMGKEQNLQEQGNPQTECKECNKTFKSRHALTSHLSSVRHHPLSDIKCLADAECKKRFNSPSGQLQHLESGSCRSGMTKTKLNSAIAANDTGRIITSGEVTTQRLLEENLSASASSTPRTWSPILTPTSTEFLGSYPPSPVLTPESTLSTIRTFHNVLTLRLRTQSGFHICHLCPLSRTRKFKSRAALQQHQSSSVHAQVSISLPVLDDILFHCPRNLMGEGSQKRPLKRFSTVSGLAQHLESGACNGGTGTLRRVIEHVQEEMNGMGFGGLKLLS